MPSKFPMRERPLRKLKPSINLLERAQILAEDIKKESGLLETPAEPDNKECEKANSSCAPSAKSPLPE